MDTGFRYSTIIFDVGGTLLGFHEREPFQEFLAGVGAPASDEDARELHRRFVAVIVEARDSAEGLGANEQPLYDWWRDIFTKTWPARPDLAEEMYRWFRANRFDRTFTDVVPALEALRGLGMPLGVLSNFGTGLEELLRDRGLRDYFGFLVVSALVGVAKPDPAIFDHAVAAAQQPCSRLLYVGDHFGDDVGGARAAGLDVVLIDRADRHSDKPCPRIHSLLQLVRYIRPPAPDRRAVILGLRFEPALIPGIVPLMHDLRGRGHRLALVTGSAAAVLDQVLAPLGGLDLFEVVVTGGQVLPGKPDPESYRLAAARLGLDPGECLVVENSPLGIQAAKAAGIKCVALETSLPAQEQLAGVEQVFPNVKVLRAWLLT